MARPLRVQFSGALYHITTRGNARQNIFRNDADREEFLRILKLTIETYHWVCYAFCLMDNHYHLLIETIEGNLSHGMRDLNGRYTQKTNKKYHRSGHIFQGRFKAFIIEKDAYLLAVARYIVLNPVRANMVEHPKDWMWSSFNETAGFVKKSFVASKWLLQMFAKNVKEARKRYIKFVLDGIDGISPLSEIQEGVILGNPWFVFDIWEKTNGIEDNLEISRQERIVGRPTLLDLFKEVKSMEERNHLIALARNRCGYLNTEIARHLKISNSTVGKILKNFHHKK